MRHGHVDYFSRVVLEEGTHAVPLTALGVEQAQAAGAALSHVRFDLAVSSGYPRTRQTLAHVLAANDSPTPAPEEDARLVEIKGGPFKGVRSRRDMSAAMTFQFESAGEPGATMLEGGEVFADVLTRTSAAVEALLARPDWHTALVVAHEGVNRVLLGWMTGNGLKGVATFEQDLACINVLDFDLVPQASGRGTEIARRIIKAVNVTPYNYLKHGMNLTSLEAIFERHEAPSTAKG